MIVHDLDIVQGQDRLSGRSWTPLTKRAIKEIGHSRSRARRIVWPKTSAIRESTQVDLSQASVRAGQGWFFET